MVKENEILRVEGCNEPPRYDNHSGNRCKFFFFFFFLGLRCVRACGSNNILNSTSPTDDQQDATITKVN
jgi:hypothetical protein